MKRFIPFWLALTTTLSACEEPPPVVSPPQPTAAPVVTATATADAPAKPPVTDGDITIGEAAGVKVLVKRIAGAEISAMHLHILGGARSYSAQDAGISRLALATATRGGTEELPKDAYFRRLAEMGSEIWSESGYDYSSFKAKTLTPRWDETFALLTAAFLRPALPPAELSVQRQRQLALLRTEQSDPDGTLELLSHTTIFGGHPFANRPIGTEQTVSNLTLENVRAHLASLRETGRLVFVTVGDVDPAHVLEKVKAAFGNVPRGSYQSTPYPALRFDKATVSVTERKLSTNYIEGSFAAPSWTSPDFADAMVTVSLLQSRLFEEVRTKRNLSYAPSARLVTSTSVPYGYIYVTATDPNTTVSVMLGEVKKLQNEPVGEKELSGTKSVYLTRFLMQNEATEGQASVLATALFLGGDYRLARTLPDRIREVTAERVQACARQYLKNLQFVVLGDPAKIDKAVFSSL